MKDEDNPPGEEPRAAPQQPSILNVGFAAAARSVSADGGGEASSPGAPPGNTAPGTYKEGEIWTKILRYGVDSLYLSYEGELYGDIEAQLALLKLQAQSRRIEERSKAQFEILGHRFEVWDRGQRGFPYILADNAFRLCIASGMARNLPMVYAAISSEFLAHKGPEAAEEELRAIVVHLGDGYEYPNPSRVDLCADFQTNADLELPGRRAWVGRARSVNAYSQDGDFTGWTIGQGSVMSARLYNKTLEALKTNKAWFFPLWSRAGMNSDFPVWRMEFQVMRGVLLELGIRSFRSLLDNLGGIWQYATQDWLRFTVPLAGDTNRRRWPSHPVWGTLANLRLRLDDAPLSRSFSSSRLPSLERLQRMYMGLLTSFMAAKGITDYRFGVQAFVQGSEDLHRNFADSVHKVSLDEWVVREVREKGRRFNTISNAKENEDAEGTDIGAENETNRGE